MVREMLTSRWGVEVVATERDIENLTYHLNGSVTNASDYFVSKLGDTSVLRTALWDSITDNDVLHDVALSDIRLIASCCRLTDGFADVNISTVFEFQTDHLVLQRQSAQNSVQCSAVKGREYWAKPSDLKHKLLAADSVLELRHCLAEMETRQGWWSLYKMLECLEEMYGGQHHLIATYPNDASDIARFKRTANAYHRHYQGKFVQPKHPISLEDAKKLLNRLAQSTLEKRKNDRARPIIPEKTEFLIPNLRSPDGKSFSMFSFGVHAVQVESGSLEIINIPQPPPNTEVNLNLQTVDHVFFTVANVDILAQKWISD